MVGWRLLKGNMAANQQRPPGCRLSISFRLVGATRSRRRQQGLKHLHIGETFRQHFAFFSFDFACACFIVSTFHGRRHRMPCCCKNEHRVAGMSRRQFKTLFSIALVDMELRDFQSKLVIHLHASASLPTVRGGFLLRGRRRAASRPQDLHEPYYVTRGHIGVAEGKEALKPVGDQPLPLASGPQTKVDHLHWTFLEGLQRGTNKGEFGQNELVNAAIRRKTSYLFICQV